METNTIAHRSTSRGYGIAVLHNTYNTAYYHVARTFRGQFIVISDHADEASARRAANREWAADQRAA